MDAPFFMLKNMRKTGGDTEHVREVKDGSVGNMGIL